MYVVQSLVCKTLALWPEFCHTSSCSMESLLWLCRNRADWLEYALLCTMVKNLAGSYFGFLYRNAFICWAKGKGDFFYIKKCWLQLVVDWSVGIAEGKDVSWLGRNRSVRLGTSWCRFCRCHEIRISSARGIRGGIFRLWSWGAVWKWCTRWRHCHSV